MKIRVTDLPPEGRHIRETLSLENLNARLSEGRSVDIKFVDAPVADITVTPNIAGAHTNGTVRSAYFQDCAHCLDPIRREVEVRADFSLQRTLPGSEVSPEEASAEGVLFYDGDYVDLEGLIQENLLLSLSLYWQPERDACGICSVCKKKPSAAMVTESESKPTLGQVLSRVLSDKDRN